MHQAHINSQGTLTLNLGIPSSELVLGEKLGTGGYGTVYKGQRKRTAVAIKELDIRGQVSEKVLDEFKKEALIMAQLGLQCPQLVRLIGVCFEQPYRIVMELLMKGSLYDVLRSSTLGPDWLKWKQSIAIARDIAIGLEFLHENGVIHRDIKSLNVLLDQHLSAKISDYGLAKIKQTSSSSGSAKSAVGTLPWMAPELLSEDEPPYSFASDIYGYGQVLWEMAMHRTPQTPFASAKNPALLMRKIIMGPPEPIPGDTPIYFSSLIERCRAQTPTDRPTIAHIIDELTKALDTAPSHPTTYPRIEEIESAFTSIHLSPQHTGSSSPALSSLESSPTSEGLLLFSSQALPPRPLTPPRPYVVTPRTQQALAQFLHHVGYGEQDEAEQLLQRNPNLAALKGTLTDCGLDPKTGQNRVFIDITGFQYAVLALDYHMWNMIKKYLDKINLNLARAQIQELEQIATLTDNGWIIKESASSWPNISLLSLIQALDTYIKNYDAWSGEQCSAHWRQQVGGAQLILPAHVINEYSHPSRPLYPCPKWNTDDDTVLPRTGVGDWRTGGNGNQLGNNFAWVRGEWRCRLEWDGHGNIYTDYAKQDRAAMAELLKSRTKQAQILRNIVTALPSTPSSRPNPMKGY